jgi:hypothetical protein
VDGWSESSACRAPSRALAETIWTISESLTGVDPHGFAVAVVARQGRRVV